MFATLSEFETFILSLIQSCGPLHYTGLLTEANKVCEGSLDSRILYAKAIYPLYKKGCIYGVWVTDRSAQLGERRLWKISHFGALSLQEHVRQNPRR